MGRIKDLPGEITTGPAVGDYLVIEDIGADETKKIEAQNLGIPKHILVEVDLATAAAAFTLYTVPASSSFIPISVLGRCDTDVTATTGDYWAVGVDGANRRVDYGVCATAAVASKHSKNAKIRFLNSSELTNQIVAAGEILKLISVDGTGDAAAKSNNIGGAGQQVTIEVRGWLVTDLVDL